jgi:hypothetical protein
LQVSEGVNGEVIRPGSLDDFYDGIDSVCNRGQIALLGSPNRQLEMCWHAHIAHGLKLKGYTSRQLTFFLFVLLLSLMGY